MAVWVAGQAGADAECDREVGLAGPLGPPPLGPILPAGADRSDHGSGVFCPGHIGDDLVQRVAGLPTDHLPDLRDLGHTPMRVLSATVPGASGGRSGCRPAAPALATLEHTIPTANRPEQAMRVVREAIGGAVALEGERGEADEFAAVPLERLRTAA